MEDFKTIDELDIRIAVKHFVDKELHMYLGRFLDVNLSHTEYSHTTIADFKECIAARLLLLLTTEPKKW